MILTSLLPDLRFEPHPLSLDESGDCAIRDAPLRTPKLLNLMQSPDEHQPLGVLLVAWIECGLVVVHERGEFVSLPVPGLPACLGDPGLRVHC